MPKSLADGRTKLTILVDEPVNPEAPTITELNAGIDVSCDVLASDFTFGATDSDKVQEKALCEKNNANALGPSNYSMGLTFFRYFDATTKNAHATEDAGFQAVKAKGSEVWAYARENARDSDAAWTTADEIYLGVHAISDVPQPPSDRGGYTKRRVPFEVQSAWDNITAVAGS